MIQINKKYSMKIVGPLLIFTFGFFLHFNVTSQESKESDAVNWVSIEEAMEKNKQEPRKIFIDVYTDWCGWCKKMDANTFTHPVIMDYLNNDFYAVKFDAESKEPVTLGDKTFVNKNKGNRSTHQFAMALLQGKMSYPSTAYLDEKIQLLGSVPGYMTPAKLEQILAFFATDAYKTKKFDAFKKSFESKIEE